MVVSGTATGMYCVPAGGAGLPLMYSPGSGSTNFASGGLLAQLGVV